MMIAVEDSLTKQKPSATLKLTVMSKNTPAVSLYKSLGFVAPGVYGALDAMPFNFLIEMEKKLWNECGYGVIVYAEWIERWDVDQA